MCFLPWTLPTMGRWWKWPDLRSTIYKFRDTRIIPLVNITSVSWAVATEGRGGGWFPAIFSRLALCLWALHGKNRLQMALARRPSPNRCAVAPPLIGILKVSKLPLNYCGRNTTEDIFWGGLTQGRRHEVLFWGDGFIGTQTHLPQNISFSSDFGHFILKMVENAKFSYVSRKKVKKYHHFWRGDVPRWFFDCGGRVPRPIRFTPMGLLDLSWWPDLKLPGANIFTLCL